MRNSPKTKENMPARTKLLSFSWMQMDLSIINFDIKPTKIKQKELRRLMDLISGTLWLIVPVKSWYQLAPNVKPAIKAIIIKKIPIFINLDWIYFWCCYI